VLLPPSYSGLGQLSPATVPSSSASNVFPKGMLSATAVGFSGAMPTTSSSAPVLPQVSARSLSSQFVPASVTPARLGSFEDRSTTSSTARELTARAVSPYRPPPVSSAEVSASASFRASVSATPRTRIASAPRAISPARDLRELSNTFTEIISQAPIAYGGSLKPQPQLNQLPQRLDDPSMGSPQFLSGRGEGDRRPTEPFFYPTTVVPLTRFGLHKIDSTIPPKTDASGPPREPASDLSGSQDETLKFVSAPLRSFVEQPEEMRVLQDQNDSLEKQIQALEHAKSLAAVQSAQALQKIRARQEQLRREAQQAFQRSKEMQAEFALPSIEPCTAPLSGSVKAPEAISQSGGLSERPEWNQEAWRDLPQQLRTSKNDLEVALAHERANQIPSSSQCFQSAQAEIAPNLPAFDVPLSDTSGMANRILAAHGAPYAGSGPSFFGTQSTASSSREVSAVPAPYVDALGNPLGPTKISELPNIKDDPPPVTDTQAHERSSLNVNSISGLAQQAPSVASTISAGHGFVQQTSVSQALLQQELQVSPQRAHEVGTVADGYDLGRPVQQSVDDVYTGVAHERVLLSSRQAGSDSARLGVGTDTQVSRQQQEQQRTNDGTGDVAAGVASPAPVPPEAPKKSTQNEAAVNRTPQGSQRPPRRESGATSGSRGRRKLEEEAPQRLARRDRSNSKPPIPPNRGASGAGQRAADTSDANLGDTSGNQLKNLPPNVSEELQAELEECLDMIRWCSASVTRDSLQDLKNTTHPPGVVHDVLEAVALLLGQPETRWDKLKKMIASPTFLERIQRLNFQQNTTKEMFRQLRDYLIRADFDEEQIKQVCVPVVPLAMWCRCIAVYLSKVKFRGGPEIRPVAAAGGAFPQQQVDRRPPPSDNYNMIFEPDLATMSQEELKCVQDLTISRHEVGTITFHGTTDCTNLDFSRIVRLEIGEVLVYPDSSLKPPVGVGLNKPAMVTMFQCWPPNGSRLLQDQKSQDKYKKKIKQMTEEKHATFLDYDCNTGIWKFCVEHF